MAPDEAAWAEIERLYVEGEDTVAVIAARFAIKPKQVTERIKARGLPLRMFPWKPKSRTPKPASSPPAAATGKPVAAAEAPAAAAPPPPAAKRRVRTKPSHVLTAGSDPTKAARDALISRLYRALAKKIEHLEDRLDNTDGADPAISEQQTRELNAAVSAFEKVTEVHTDADKARAAVERTGAITSRADLERLRRDLAERLHRVWGDKKR